jgi:hypothetical protein
LTLEIISQVLIKWPKHNRLWFFSLPFAHEISCPPSGIFLGVISFLQLATNTSSLVLPHINTTRQNKSFKHWHNHKKLINAKSLHTSTQPQRSWSLWVVAPCINRTLRKLEEFLISYPHTSTYLKNVLKICNKSNPHALTT